MARNRFIGNKPPVRLELSEGDWIEVKERLTYGEEQRLASGAFDKVSRMGAGDPEFSMDMERYNVLRLYTWITDWSFIGENKKPVKLSKEAIADMDPDDVAEIDAALTAHIERVEAEKKANQTPTTSSAETK